MIAMASVIASASAQNPPVEAFPQEQIKRGAETFSEYCTPCHGERMSNPD